MIEIPLPIPFSVTSSPSHIKNTVPETKDVTAMIWNIKPGSNASPWFCKPSAKPLACINAKKTVPYLT